MAAKLPLFQWPLGASVVITLLLWLGLLLRDAKAARRAARV